MAPPHGRHNFGNAMRAAARASCVHIRPETAVLLHNHTRRILLQKTLVGTTLSEKPHLHTAIGVAPDVLLLVLWTLSNGCKNPGPTSESSPYALQAYSAHARRHAQRRRASIRRCLAGYLDDAEVRQPLSALAAAMLSNLCFAV